jgi:hypothetical protein
MRGGSFYTGSKAISGRKPTCLAAEWGVAIPPFTKEDEDEFLRKNGL